MPDDPDAGRYLVVDAIVLADGADPDRAVEQLRQEQTGPSGARVYTARRVDDPRRLVRYAQLAGSREQVLARVGARPAYQVVAVDDRP
ncbi:hypothetical protein Athai_23930 [Actinocatenispora thailandica]|uniref:Uncharacterized protein n=1 Tax=Actinocatenispora thailandica TaxID=227318 RepID=A0A7R7DNC1_9ACTN|nr:hypothetical protein [Actinocatenispora thailandica]BCJ34890.1 hypothetical protein Athai_23930 [Actinocatenispora thailandica]